MPILASTLYVNAYGKSSAVNVELNLNALQAGQDAFIVKYNSLGKAQWSARLGSIGTDTAYGIVTDPSGNIYVTGEANSQFTAYNADGTTSINNTIGNTNTTSDVFIVKYNPSGTVQWVSRISSASADRGNGIDVDPSGNVYITGYGGGSSNVLTAYNADGSAFATTITNASSVVFIAKLNTNGVVQWFTRIAATNGNGIGVDSSGNVYVTGNSTGTVTAFNANGTSFATTLTNSGLDDVFLVKYDTNGSVQWIAKLASTSTDIGYDVDVDSSGNVYLCGFYTATFTAFNANGTSFATTLADSGGGDCFVVKYNTSGSVQWVARFGTTDTGNTDFAYALTTDSSGNVYITGRARGSSLVAYNANGTTFGTMSLGSALRLYLIKYNTNGTVQWMNHIRSLVIQETITGWGVVTDAADNVYLTGRGGADVSMALYNSDATVFGTLSNNLGNTAVILVKYNPSGFVQWGTMIQSTNAEEGTSIAADSNNNIYVTGFFNGASATVYGQTLSLFTTIPNSGAQDAYLVKYNTNGAPQWAARVASTGGDIAYGVASDSSGNVYITGSTGVAVTTAFNSDGTAFATTIPNFPGNGEVFVVKYNTNGFVQWVARITGSASTSQDIGYAITTDSSGDVYVTGKWGGTALHARNADGTLFGTNPASIGGGDAFIVKYNTNGFVQWVTRFGSTLGDVPYAITSDSSSNIYVTGEGGAGTITVYNSDSTAFATTIPNAGSGDMFIIKYNGNGFVQWVTRLASTALDTGYGIASDPSGNIYVTGLGGINTTITAYNSDGTTFATTIAGYSAFIVKYNTNGFVQWITRGVESGTGSVETGQAIATDSSGNVYLTGRDLGSITEVFNSDGTKLKYDLPSVSSYRAFVVKYNTNGFAQWVAGVGFTSSTSGFGIATDSSGSVYVTGVFGDASTLISVFHANNTRFTQVYASSAVVKYNTNGFAQWVGVLRGTAGTADNRAISVDTTGNAYVAGNTPSGEALRIYNTDTTPYRYISSFGSTDAYIVKYSSNTTPLWVARIASSGADVGYAIATDSSGNVYVTGQGGNSVVVSAYNADGTAFATTLPNNVGDEAFIAKYNTNGSVQWLARVGTTSTGDIGYGIATDSSGNVYATGVGSSGAVITAYNANGTAFGTTLTNNGFTDAFIVKYDTNGSVQWLAKVSANGNDIGYSVTTDPSGNVYVTGVGGSSVVVTAYNANGTAFGTTLPNAGNQDSFIVKYNTSGSVQWVARIGGSGNDFAYAITSDSSGNIYVAGMASADAVTTAFSSNGTAFATTLPSAGSTDGFLVKYDTGGIVQWVARVASTSNEEAYSVATDSSGNVYMCGFYGSTLTAYNANGTAFATTVTNAGAGDAFLVKYNTSGSVQWLARMQSTTTDRAFSVATDSAGDVYVTGTRGSEVELRVFNADGTLFGSSTSFVTGFDTSTFVVKYNTNGVVQWISDINGNGADQGRGIALDSSGNIYTTGSILGSSLIPYSV